MLYIIDLYLSDMKNKFKPNKDTIGVIVNTITKNKVSITIEELATELSINGKTCMLGILEDNIVKKHYPIISQELIMLDFDNSKEVKYSLSECLSDEFIKNNALFVYKTFSDTKSDVDKFRVVFKLDKIISDTFKIEYIYNKLFEKYPSADFSCNYPSRIFYGGNQGYIEVNFNNVVNTDNLLLNFSTDELINQRKNMFDYSKSIDTTNNSAKVDLKNIPNDKLKNWELIKKGEYSELKERLGNEYSKVFASKSQAHLHFKSSIDLREFLGIDESSMFCDIFHDEENPSANIFLSDSNTYLYKCFSENHLFVGDIIRVVSKLTGLGMFKSIELIINLTNSRVDIDSNIAKIKSETDVFIGVLENPDIKEIYPEVYRILGRHIPEVVKILQIITDYKYEDIETGEVRIISFLSISSLNKQVSHSLQKSISEKRMKRIINLMTLSNIVLKLSEGQIPEYILESLSAKTYHKNKPNVLEVTGYDDMFMQDLQIKCEQLLEKDFTLVALSFDFLARNFGKEEAQRVYPQVDEKLSKKLTDSNETVEREIVSYLIPLLEKEDFIIENDLKEHVSKLMLSKELSDYKWKQIRNDIINKYDLKRVRLTKLLREELNIKNNDNRFPMILMKNKKD